MTVLHTDEAWNLIGFDSDWAGQTASVRIKGGRTLYEAVMYDDATARGPRPRLARLDTRRGLRQVNRYVDPQTIVEIVAA